MFETLSIEIYNNFYERLNSKFCEILEFHKHLQIFMVKI